MKPKKAAPIVVQSLSNSERQLFANCRRKYFWSYIKGYKPIATPTPFLVGSVVHKMLQLFYSGEKFDVQEIVDEIFQPAMRGEGRLSPEQLEDLQKQEAMVLGMCDAYVEVYKDDLKKWKVIKVNGKPAVELVGNFKITPGWEMYFTVDMLVEEKGRPWVVEHKTTASIDPGYISRLALDEQISTYLHGCKLAWNIKPDGVIYNVIMKPRIRQKQNEQREEYLSRVLQLYKENPQEYLYRCRVLRSDADMVIFKDELALFVKEMDSAKASGFYYKNVNVCTGRGTCPFISLCVEGEEQAKDRFEVRKNPRERYNIVEED